MFTVKGIFEYIFKGIQESLPYRTIENILKPKLPFIEQRELLSLYHDVKDIYDKGQQIADLYIFDKVPISLGTISPWDWKNAFTMRAKLTGFDNISQSFVTQYVTVGSDNPMDKEGWLKLLEEAGQSLFGNYNINVQNVQDFQYFVRKR